MNKIYLVQSTFPNAEEAGRVGRALVEARLAACVLLTPGAASIYWWKGEVCSADEVVAQFKTTGDRLRELIGALKERHSYELPEIIAVPVAHGLPPYLQWVKASTTA